MLAILSTLYRVADGAPSYEGMSLGGDRDSIDEIQQFPSELDDYTSNFDSPLEARSAAFGSGRRKGIYFNG